MGQDIVKSIALGNYIIKNVSYDGVEIDSDIDFFAYLTRSSDDTYAVKLEIYDNTGETKSVFLDFEDEISVKNIPPNIFLTVNLADLLFARVGAGVVAGIEEPAYFLVDYLKLQVFYKLADLNAHPDYSEDVVIFSVSLEWPKDTARSAAYISEIEIPYSTFKKWKFLRVR